MTSNPKLIDLYYQHLFNRYQKSATILLLKDPKKDKEYLIKYQNRAKKLGVDIKTCNEILVNIFNILFDNYTDIIPENTPFSLSFLLGPGEWVLRKVYQKYLTKYKTQLHSELLAFYSEQPSLALEKLIQKRHKELIEDNAKDFQKRKSS